MQANDVRMTLSEVEKMKSANAMLMHENRVLRARVNALLAMTDDLKKKVINLTNRVKFG